MKTKQVLAKEIIAKHQEELSKWNKLKCEYLKLNDYKLSGDEWMFDQVIKRISENIEHFEELIKKWENEK